MMVSSTEMKRILTDNMTSTQSIERSSVRLLDMMGWLIRNLLQSDPNLIPSLQQLGVVHRKMGIDINHFDPMLNSMHETLSYYFPIKYGVQIKYAIDQIFTLAAKIMTGQNPNEVANGYHLSDLHDEMKDHAFLKSLKICMESQIGREYLYRYLQQTFCDEIVIFLEWMNKFRKQTSDKERFMVARDIVKNSIESEATFSINVSYETRQNALSAMKAFENTFSEKSDLKVDANLFLPVETEIFKLINDNHWIRFTQTFKNVDSGSGDAQEIF